MNKLNFGCGSIQPGGWFNFDADPQFDADKYLNLFSQLGQFDMIVCHCSLQMNDWHDLPGLLRQLRELLKEDGVIRISLPDIETGFQEYAKGNIGWFPNGELDLGLRFSAWLTWYSTTRTLLTRGALIARLHEAGFSDIKQADFAISALCDEEEAKEITSLDTREHECYFMEARK